MTRLRPLAASLSVLVLALGATACGSSDEASPARPGTSSSDGGDLTKATFISTITDAQLDARSSHVVMDIGVGGQSIKAEGDIEVGESADDTSMAMTMDMGAAGLGALKMVLVDSTLYLSVGELTKGKYATIDLDDEDSPFGQQFGSLADQLDPSKQLEQFDAALVSVEKKGSPTTLDGVDAQPYELVLDTTKIKAFQDLPGGAGASVPKTITYLMYVGPDHLLRRTTADVAGSKVRVDYSRWGKDVEVEAPPADEVTDQDLSRLGAPTA